jgi:hypothetical protein
VEKAPRTARLEYIGTVAAANSTHRTSSHGLMSTAPSSASLDKFPAERGDELAPSEFAKPSDGVQLGDSTGYEDLDERDANGDYSAYRSLSPAAVLSCVLGIASFLAFFDWSLVAVPLAGIATGVFALRRIAARSDEITGRVPASVGVALAIIGLVGGQARLWYIRISELPPGHVRISYSDLQPPERSPVPVPESAHEFDGKRVLIKGYVLAGNRKDGIRTFILVRDKGDCCFGGNPRLTDRILVQLKPGYTFSYTDRLQKLAGLFHIQGGDAVDVAGNVVYQLEDAEFR